jgi:epoxyqueuosine reductase
MHFTFGNPERATDPARSLPGARSLIVGALAYAATAPDAPSGTGTATVARYSWRDRYAELRRALRAIADELQRAGWQTQILCDDNRLVDRAAAQRAGLGWIGKNTLLLLPGAGSWFLLGSVLTDAPLTAAAAVAQPGSGCGTCRRCRQACPTGALVADGVLDARRCLAWLLQAPGSFPADHRQALGGRIYGCDDCQVACPPNRLAARRQPPPPPAAGDQATVDLLALLDADDAELLARFGHWYIPRRHARYLRRNALVALGNVGDGGAPEVQRTLRRHLADPDPLLRAHAAWAAGRLGCRHLLHPLSGDPDPQVRAEVQAALR